MLFGWFVGFWLVIVGCLVMFNWLVGSGCWVGWLVNWLVIVGNGCKLLVGWQSFVGW